MSAPAQSLPPSSLTATLRDKELLLLALAKDVLTSAGHDSLRIDDKSETFLVSRVPMPVRLDETPVECSPDHARELQRRASSLDRSELLFEYE